MAHLALVVLTVAAWILTSCILYLFVTSMLILQPAPGQMNTIFTFLLGTFKIISSRP